MKRQWKTKLPATKNYSIVVGFLSILGVALYPSIIYPMLYPDSYKKAQEENRRGINQEDIQPGNMRIWRDPFDREKVEINPVQQQQNK